LFRSKAQGRLLAAVLADPGESHSLSELATRAATSLPTAGREVGRAEQAGIVTTERRGNTRLVRAVTSHPLYRPLAQVVLATWGAPVVIAEELGPIPQIDRVMIFGSWAARWHGQPGPAPNDIDVLVVGSPDRDLLEDAAQRAEERLHFPVQVTVRRPEQFSDADDPFLAQLRRGPTYEVIG
jgi:predicted nucleotidyltransferase